MKPQNQIKEICLVKQPILLYVVCHRGSPAKTLSEGIFRMQIQEISDQLQFSIRWVPFMENIFSSRSESQLHDKSGSVFVLRGVQDRWL